MKILYCAVLATVLAVPATAQERPWVFQCSVKNCYKDYAASMRFIESEMNKIASWFDAMGYDPARMAKGSGRGWKENTPLTGAPQVNIVSPIYFEGGSIAHYDHDARWIELSTGASEKTLNQYQQLSTGHVPEGQVPITSVDSGKLQSTLAHEFYHAVQSGDNQNVGDVPWIIEGTAVAAGTAWLKKRLGRNRTILQYYDEPLHLDAADKEYQRGHFFYEAGKKLIPREPMRAYVDMYEKVTGGMSKTNAYQPVDMTFRAHGSSLHDIYNRVIAEEANSEKFYEKLAKTIKAEARDGTIKADTSRVKAWSAQARHMKVMRSALKRPAQQKPDRAEFALVTIEMPDERAPDHAGLAIEYEWVKSRKKHYLFDLVEKEIEFLVRATNINRTGVPETQDHEIGLQLRVAPVTVEMPSCVAATETVELLVEGLPEDVDAEFSAKRGKITNGTFYTAPSGGKDTIFVNAYVDRKTKRKVKALEVDIRNKRCAFKLISADGYSFTYDPSTATTLARDPSGRHLAYFDREFIYANDPSMGQVKLHKSVMQRFGAQMMGRAAGLLSAAPSLGFDIRVGDVSEKYAAVLNAGGDPFSWGRAPYDFLIMLEYPVLKELSRKYRKRIKEVRRPRCPAETPKCRMIVIDGRDRIIYGPGPRISRIQLHTGDTHRVERAKGPIVAPGNARLIRF